MLNVMIMMLIAAGAGVPQAAGKAVDSEDKVICKKFTETGSLVATKRECKTKRDWDREREDVRANEGPMANGCRSSGSGGVC